MAREVQHGVARARFVAVRIGNQCARVVWDDQLRHAAIKGQRACNAAEPVLHRFGRRCTRECVTRRAHGRHEDMRAAPGGQRQRRTSKVDEQLLAGTMDLSH